MSEASGIDGKVPSWLFAKEDRRLKKIVLWEKLDEVAAGTQFRVDGNRENAVFELYLERGEI